MGLAADLDHHGAGGHDGDDGVWLVLAQSGIDRAPQDALKELVQAALDVSQIPVRTGRDAPTVIT